ncbi:carboxyltransferase domain-containing protein [Staphylococcus felis]|uniref:carboxyltransferase domain-containing protein n=1 Tax=Staphylococcus felis TaxID=46127 RepID=UPI000CD0FFE5|nr:carboxyltransferase domain-containing protein [Staphylococcus felis]AVP35642.1 allophanate hydrolase [Staphylococcus felis]PNZ32109.1 allophanate hydrolase [Staphylococcus felis]QQB04370.1 carboxyltransferase domain-containing protein [Staphylococcus felis]
MKVYSQGDQAIIVSGREPVTPASVRQLLAVRQYLLEKNEPFITEIVPTETDMLISYDARMMMKHLDIPSPFLYLKDMIEHIKLDELVEGNPKFVEVPVYYDNEHGPHLPQLLDELDLDLETFIQYHTAPNYFVSMMGYSPGFPYLTEMDKRIVVNHTASKKRMIPAGSIIVENHKCGITTTDLYEDWLVIGYTPLKLFDSSQKDFTRIALGDTVKFSPIQRGGHTS